MRLLYIPILIHTTIIWYKMYAYHSTSFVYQSHIFWGSPPFTPPKKNPWSRFFFFTQAKPLSPQQRHGGRRCCYVPFGTWHWVPFTALGPKTWWRMPFQEALRLCRRKRPFKSMRSWWRTCNPCPVFFLKIYDEIDFWIYIYIKHEVFRHSLGCFIYDEIDFEYFYKTWRLFS